MKKTITAMFLFAAASAAFASECCTVSAHAEAKPVSASYDGRAKDEIVAPNPEDGKTPASIIAMTCCTVSRPDVSAPQAAEEGEGSIALAGLGFGLVGLIGVGKMARRKKAKADDIRP